MTRSIDDLGGTDLEDGVIVRGSRVKVQSIRLTSSPTTGVSPNVWEVDPGSVVSARSGGMVVGGVNG